MTTFDEWAKEFKICAFEWASLDELRKIQNDAYNSAINDIIELDEFDVRKNSSQIKAIIRLVK